MKIEIMIIVSDMADSSCVLQKDSLEKRLIGCDNEFITQRCDIMIKHPEERL